MIYVRGYFHGTKTVYDLHDLRTIASKTVIPPENSTLSGSGNSGNLKTNFMDKVNFFFPDSHASVERVFSSAKWHFEDRERLSPEKLGKETMIRVNSKALGYQP